MENLVFVRIGCLGKRKVCISSCPCHATPVQCHIWETCCRRLRLSLSSVFRDGESFLSGQATRRGRGWVRTPEGRTQGVRQGAGTATRSRANGEEEESFLRPLLCRARAPPLLCSPLPLSLSLFISFRSLASLTPSVVGFLRSSGDVIEGL